MDKFTKKLVQEMALNPPTSKTILTDIESKLQIKLPDQYIAFMTASNGAEGIIGPNSYLSIWPAEEILQLNEDYAVNEFTPGLVYFGSNGGGIAYAFDFRSATPGIAAFPFESTHVEDAIFLGNTFVEFLQHLYEYKNKDEL